MEANTPNGICNVITIDKCKNKYEKGKVMQLENCRYRQLIQRICWKRGEHHGESVSNRLSVDLEQLKDIERFNS